MNVRNTVGQEEETGHHSASDCAAVEQNSNLLNELDELLDETARSSSHSTAAGTCDDESEAERREAGGTLENSASSDVCRDGGAENSLVNGADAEHDYESINSAANIVGSGKLTSKTGMTVDTETMSRFYERYSVQCAELERLEHQNNEYREQLLKVLREKDVVEKHMKEATLASSVKEQELERRLLEVDYQLKATKDRLAAQESHFRKAYNELHCRLSTQVEQFKKSAETAQHEKDSAVIKFAQREAELLNLSKAKSSLTEQLAEITGEKESLEAQVSGAASRKETTLTALEQKDSELGSLHKESERLTNLLKEADVRVKVANAKVDEVEQSHKKTKLELDGVQKRISDAQEESRMARLDYQKLIGRFQAGIFIIIQQNEEKTEHELKIHKQEQSDQEEIHKAVVEELEAIKRQHKVQLQELQETKGKYLETFVKCDQLDEQLQKMAGDRAAELEELTALRETAKDVEKSRSMASECMAKMLEAIDDQIQAEKEASDCRAQAERMLQLTEELSAKNSELTAANGIFERQVDKLTKEKRRLEEEVLTLSSSVSELTNQVESATVCHAAEVDSLNQRLNEKIMNEQKVSTQLEDETAHNQILRKKHSSSLRDLKQELQSMKRRLQHYESAGGTCSVATAPLSRHSSIGSLENNSAVASSEVVAQTADGASSAASEQEQERDQQSLHQQAMIEKIVKLQRALARRMNKVEFLEEHVKTLVDELRQKADESQNKSRIIKMYALREEVGTLRPMNEVENSASLRDVKSTAGLFWTAGKSGVGGLAEEINGKLEAVLEDALIKNIALQENLETLGQEISRLSRENRELNLKLTSDESVSLNSISVDNGMPC